MLSLNMLTQAIRQCARRFPVTVCFITMLTIYWLATVWTDGDLFPDDADVTINYYLAVGILLTTVLQLWGEEVKNRHTKLAANAVAHTALLADAAYIYTIYANPSMEIVLSHASAITALTLCMFILPFFREKDDIASWNFTLRLLLAGCTSWITGGIMCGGISLLTMAVEQLFNIDLSSKWWSTWFILFMWTLPALLFIGRIPAKEEKHDRTPRMSTFMHKSIHYLFLPLLGCYLAVLYGYLAKIIIEWQLPDGWVSNLVSALTFGNIAIAIGLYPLLKQGTSKTDNRIVRILQPVILPLLALMTVGIARRLSDYGVTVNRLYLLTLNIWFYVVCVGMFLSRVRRVWWIAASFAAFFLITSVLPVNITSFTRNWIHERVETVIKNSYKGKLPMSEDTYFNWITTLPAEEALQLNSRLQYLDDILSDKTAGTLVSDSVSWWKAENLIEDKVKGKSKNNSYYYYSRNKAESHEIKFDGQYASMLVYTDTEAAQLRPKGNTLQVPIYKDKKPVDTLKISISDLRKWDALSVFTPRDIPCRHNGNRFILTSFTLQNYTPEKEVSLTYSGCYLIKKDEP